MYELSPRLDRARERLTAASGGEPPKGLSDPDPGEEERWDAGQVWAHVAEFVPYWTAQVRQVLAGSGDEPVPFGRIKSDPDRIAAVARDRGVPPPDLMRRTSAALEEVRALIAELDAEALGRIGLHPVRGEMPVSAIIEHHIVRHLEEHADALERLASSGANLASA